jgi:hypothetical protein
MDGLNEATVDAILQARLDHLALLLLIALVIASVIIVRTLVPLIREANADRRRHVEELRLMRLTLEGVQLRIDSGFAEQGKRTEQQIGLIDKQTEDLSMMTDVVAAKIDALRADMKALSFAQRG